MSKLIHTFTLSLCKSFCHMMTVKCDMIGAQMANGVSNTRSRT
jgi:hypothetical protein